jgi:hypothetical protein
MIQIAGKPLNGKTRWCGGRLVARPADNVSLPEHNLPERR